MVKIGWGDLARTGIKDDLPGFLQREIILTNQLTLILAFMSLLSLTAPFTWVHTNITIATFITLLLCISILVLNENQQFNISRIIACIVLLLVQFIAFTFFGDIKSIYFNIFPLVVLGYLMFPLLVLDPEHERSTFILALSFNFLLLIFHNNIFQVFSAQGIPEREDFFLYKFTQISFWVILVFMIVFLRGINKRFEEKLNLANNDLQLLNEKNYEQIKEISAQNEEIVAQNEELISQQEQLSRQSEYIETQNTELKEYQKELKDYIFRISKTKEQLAQKEAENRSILNVLKRKFRTIVYDVSGNVISISPLVLGEMEIDEGDILGKNVHQVLGRYLVEPANLDFDAFWRSIIDQQIITQDFRFCIDEEEVIFRATYSVIHDADDNITKVISISEDITSLVNQQKVIEEKNKILEVQKKEIEDKNEELEQQKEEIEAINETLEERVKERTVALEKQNKQLAEYAFINAHMLRAPVSSILGLINLLNYEKLSTEEKEIFSYLSRSVNQLDKIVFKINKAIQQNAVLDRDFLKE